jgi:hypothetical protein
MIGAGEWAPYLNNSFTLIAFISTLLGTIFIRALKLTGITNKLTTMIAGVFLLGSIVALVLACFREYENTHTSTPSKPPLVENQVHQATPENTPSIINIQIANGSNIRLTNQATGKKQ